MRLPRGDWVLMAAAAALLTLAYPPFELLVPAFVCLAPAALLILRGATGEDVFRRHLHQGFWYGAITHGALLYWFAIALWDFGRFAPALWLAAAVMFGGGYAVMFAVVGRVVLRAPARIVFALPAGIVFLEWLAAQVGPIGFPWHQIALTVAAYPVLLQTADLAGAGGLAFVLGVVNVLVALAWWARDRRERSWAYLEAVAFVLFAMTVYGLNRMYTLPIVQGPRVAVVQPNALAEEKWRPEMQDGIVERAARLTEQAMAAGAPTFVAWPETALPDAVSRHPRWTGRVTQLVARTGSTILTGGVEEDHSPLDASRRYNAAFAFTPQATGRAEVVHRKQKLIPMIEQVPGAAMDLSRTGFGGFTPGRDVGVASAGIGLFGTLLCYELTFPGMAREMRRGGADVLVVLSNDAWFRRTAASHQHFAHATLRAVENRVTVLRAANSGISGIVDPLGRVVAKTRQFEEAYAIGDVQYVRRMPLAARIGGMAGPFGLALLLALAVAPVRGARTDRVRHAAHAPVRDLTSARPA